MKLFLHECDFAKGRGRVTSSLLLLASLLGYFLLLFVVAFCLLQIIPFLGDKLESHFSPHDIGVGLVSLVGVCVVGIFYAALKS